MPDQFRFAAAALEKLASLFDDAFDLVIVHGNGPQVGHMLIRVEQALGHSYNLPLEVCVAESEGEVGYVLQQSTYNLLRHLGAERQVVGLLTQVRVDVHDPAFAKPTKPIGPFFDEEGAHVLREQGLVVVEDAGRGFRRVVASPQPQEIIEIESIRTLLDQRAVVIAAGGGGIPVVEVAGRLQGVEAVIDKDLTGTLLGESIDADLLIIVTGVPCVYRDFGTPSAQPIGAITPDELQELLEAGQFAPGSMAPKVEAAIRFARKKGRSVIICDLQTLPTALAKKGGTIVSLG